jgi:TetR/AcrR family transcriptional regulator, transcriptional repressor for nem operon
MTTEHITTAHIDTRQHILDTAKPIILGKGFSAVGLNELLSEAGVPKGSFYHYFKSKERFGEALLSSYFSDYQARLEVRLTPSGNTAAERLLSYWNAWLETQASEGTEGKCLIVKLSGEVSDLSEAMRATLQLGTSRIVDRLADCIREGAADGSLPREIEAGNTALTLYNLWLGATLLTKIRRDRSALEAAMAATLRLLTLAPPPAG